MAVRDLFDCRSSGNQVVAVAVDIIIVVGGFSFLVVAVVIFSFVRGRCALVCAVVFASDGRTHACERVY